MLAFQFKKSTKGFVELRYKHRHSSKWLGQDQSPNTPGFVLLNQCPPGAPDIIEPNDGVMSPKHIVNLTGVAMQNQMKPYMASTGLQHDEIEETISWLFKSATTGQMPYTSAALGPDEEAHPGEWGGLVKMGVRGKEGDVLLVKPVVNCDSFWDLPDDLLQRHEDESREKQQVVSNFNAPPKVQYKNKRSTRTLHPTPINGQDSHTLAEDVSDRESPAQEKQWGVSVEDCKVDSFVVVEMVYGKGCGKGVEIMKITAKSDLEFVDNNISTSSSSSSSSDSCYAWLDGDSYGPAETRTKGKKKQIKSNNANSLTGRWLDTKQTGRVKNWAVMAVFKKLTASGKIPQPIINKILKLAQSKEIFQESEDETDVIENQGEEKEGFPPPVTLGLGDTASKPANPPNLKVSETKAEQKPVGSAPPGTLDHAHSNRRSSRCKLPA